MILLLLACASEEDTARVSPWDERAFAVEVIDYALGEGSGFGAALLPEVVLGPPQGRGDAAGSLDVVSLGREGEITLRLGQTLVDGAGPDLLVFENAFVGWTERGEVSVSEDGERWLTWACAPDGAGCAGLEPVYYAEGSGLCPTDPAEAGGDAFDLAELGMTHASYVRVRDVGDNDYAGISGGFDLDAVAAVGRCK